MKKIALALLLAPTAAFAMEVPETDPATGRPIQYQQTTEIIFDGLKLEGEFVGPEIALLTERPRTHFNPLIRLRTDFKAEMTASVDELK